MDFCEAWLVRLKKKASLNCCTDSISFAHTGKPVVNFMCLIPFKITPYSVIWIKSCQWDMVAFGRNVCKYCMFYFINIVLACWISAIFDHDRDLPSNPLQRQRNICLINWFLKGIQQSKRDMTLTYSTKGLLIRVLSKREYRRFFTVFSFLERDVGEDNSIHVNMVGMVHVPVCTPRFLGTCGVPWYRGTQINWLHRNGTPSRV